MTATIELHLNEILRLARERADLDQKPLGLRIEMGRTTVIRYEKGVVTPQRWADVERWLDACDAAADLRVAARGAWEDARRSGCIHWAPPNQQALFDYLPDRDEAGRWMS